jgi:hypothetical protein
MPHPATSYETPAHPLGDGLPRTGIASIAPAYTNAVPSPERVRRQEGWEWHELASGHDAMSSTPDALAALLLAIAARNRV